MPEPQPTYHNQRTPHNSSTAPHTQTCKTNIHTYMRANTTQHAHPSIHTPHRHVRTHAHRVLTWIRNQTRLFTWIGHHFYYKLTILGQNTYFCCLFNEFGVCVLLEPLFLIVCYNSAYIPGFELVVFKPFFIKMFKVFLWNACIYSIWGFDPDWLDKQAFAPILLTWTRNQNHFLTLLKWPETCISCSYTSIWGQFLIQVNTLCVYIYIYML